jgi:hypothetical protein
MPPSLLHFLSFFLLILLHASAQSIVPPLQWINLSAIIKSTNGPPALKDAVIGYDDGRYYHFSHFISFNLFIPVSSSRSLIVFGGESQGGISQSQTYL